MTPKRLVITSMAAFGFALSAVAAETDQIAPEATRGFLEQWVHLRTLISEEESSWRSDKATIADSIELIKSEMENLTRSIDAARETQSAAEQQRQELNQSNDELRQAAAAVRDQLGPLEAKLLQLAQFFPRHLRTQIEPLEQRIPRPGAMTRAGTGERLQNIVGILNQVERFNRTVSIASNVQTLPNGENAQVDTIYLGLGAAFFVDGRASYAGILTPAQGEWTVTPRPELASRIRALIEVYRTERLAEFVPVPIEIR